MTVHHRLGCHSQQTAHVVIAQACGDALGIYPRRMPCRRFNGTDVTVVGREDVHYALAVLTVIDCRHDQAISKNLFLVRHLGSLFPDSRHHASLCRASYVPQGGGAWKAPSVTRQGVRSTLIRRPMTSEALAFNEVQCQLVGRLQRARLRVEDDATDVAPRAVIDRDLLDAHPTVAGDGTHGVTAVLKAEPLLTAPSGLLLPHLQGSACLAALILQGDDHSNQPRQFGGEKATLATVKPPRNRRTRLREDI